MSNFPTSLPSFTNPTGTDYLNSPAHATQHSNENDEIVAIATKVGADSSATTSTHDYKLSSVTGTAKAVSTAGNQTVAGNKSLTGQTTVAQTIQTETNATDGATVTFNLSLGNLHKVTLGGNRILALSNAATDQCFIIRLIQDGTGSRTVTWFAGISWPGATVPTLTTTASKTDVFGFICTGSNTYDGFIVGQNL